MTPRLSYFKRFRMEVALGRGRPAADPDPPGVDWWAWEDGLIDAHAAAKYQSFHGEMDAELFPSFTSPDGCNKLMTAIRNRAGFCPAATWLAVGPAGVAGTIQGLIDADDRRVGAIQNVGVVPDYRGLGVGAGLLRRALAGFRSVRVRRVYLEVTAQNVAAVRLYRKFGFRCTKTIYKPVAPVAPAPIPLAAGV